MLNARAAACPFPPPALLPRTSRQQHARWAVLMQLLPYCLPGAKVRKKKVPQPSTSLSQHQPSTMVSAHARPACAAPSAHACSAVVVGAHRPPPRPACPARTRPPRAPLAPAHARTRTRSPSHHAQGVDLIAGGRNKKVARTAPKSDNVYLKLLVKVGAHACTHACMAWQGSARGHACSRHQGRGGAREHTHAHASMHTPRRANSSHPPCSCTPSWSAARRAASTRWCSSACSRARPTGRPCPCPSSPSSWRTR